MGNPRPHSVPAPPTLRSDMGDRPVTPTTYSDRIRKIAVDTGGGCATVIMMAEDDKRENRRVAASDETLVLGTLRGDRSAFAELYDRRARLIRAICYDATGDSHVCADFTQEVFLRAYRKLGDLADPARFTPWLVSIARRVCLEWVRTRVRDRRVFGESIEECDVSHEDNSARDDVADLREAITQLPEKDRLALHSFYLQELDTEQFEDIAARPKTRQNIYR